MAKEKKVREKWNWKKEAKLLPGYIILILWVVFTFVLDRKSVVRERV